MVSAIIICVLIGYLFGNFATAYFLGRLNKVDIRNYGSGNAGTTNAMRTLGRKAGLLTFLGDFIKAVIPLLLVRLVIFPGLEYTEMLVLITGLGAVMGHNYPFWLHFKGGKGIAVTAGVLVAFDYRMIPFAIVIFFGIVAVTKYVSVGSLCLSVLIPVWIIFTTQGNNYYAVMIVLGFLYTVSAFNRHRANLVRLKNGTENKIGQRVKIEKDGGQS